MLAAHTNSTCSSLGSSGKQRRALYIGVPLYPMPPVEQLETMWPFVAAGIRQHAVSASEHLQAGLSKAAKSAVADASATLSETSTSLLDRFMAYWV